MSFAEAVPRDYHRTIDEVEENHWWHRGMREISARLLRPWLKRGGALLDVGCGTGGFLRWARDVGSFQRLAGIDISAEGLEFARRRVPEAELLIAPIWEIPLESDSFDLVAINDVLQHVRRERMRPSLLEVRRVLRDGGALLVRTNAAWRAQEGEEWRLYDRASLRSTLEGAGFGLQRLTHVNAIGSLWANLRGARPRAPSPGRHGIPHPGSRRRGGLMYALLHAEAVYLERSPFAIPYGHTLLALATPRELTDGRTRDE